MTHYYLINRPHLALPIVPIMCQKQKKIPNHTLHSVVTSLVSFNVEQFFSLIFLIECHFYLKVLLADKLWFSDLHLANIFSKVNTYACLFKGNNWQHLLPMINMELSSEDENFAACVSIMVSFSST